MHRPESSFSSDFNSVSKVTDSKKRALKFKQTGSIIRYKVKIMTLFGSISSRTIDFYTFYYLVVKMTIEYFGACMLDVCKRYFFVHSFNLFNIIVK